MLQTKVAFFNSGTLHLYM
uniref:Uncharacterized protein n=1 Tax=Rhizophora mucronata TaxID=61149 RepID=A0A2P2NDQ3_RHIMU